MDNCKPNSFAGLPAELLLLVIEHCGKRDLAALSGVAKKYNNVCRPIIFRKVDLSIHNRGKVLCTFPTPLKWLTTEWHEASDSLQCNNIPPNMQRRQEAFLSALIGNPGLAQHVRTFSWTLLLLDSNRRTRLRIDPFEIRKSVALDPKSPFHEIWNVFASLTSVQTLDLAWLSRHLAMPLIHNIPSTLFPTAISVRLVGIMPYTLAASILLANPRALRHLDLDNLQQSGKLPSTRKIAPGKVRRPHRQTRQPWNSLDRFRDEREYFNAPGPMQNLLGTLAGKCTSLRSLHLRKTGARDHFDLTPACSIKENDIYAEWAMFLTSVKPTLESLTFEQGERLLPKADQVQPPVRPMDQLFGDRIFPVLMEAGVGQWPRMKKVVIRGVQQWEEDDGRGTGEVVLVDGRAELMGAFGNEAESVIERRAREADHLGMPDQCGG